MSKTSHVVNTQGTSELVSVSSPDPEGRPRGFAVASATLMDFPEMGIVWFINRVMAAPAVRGYRTGLGAALVRAMVKKCEEMNATAPIVVSPGGYNTPAEVLHAFYTHCGFGCYGTIPGMYVYEGNGKRSEG